jgi:hypothetical protein
MQDKIDKILDLTINLFQEKYNFVEVYPTVVFFKSSLDSDIDYKGLQIIVNGIYKHDSEILNIKGSAILTFADETYEELLDRALAEMIKPREETLRYIENLIIKPSIKKVESI